MAHEYSFLVIKYPKAGTAAEALTVLKEMADDDLVKLRDAVAITKTANGKVKIHQTKDDTIGKGFVKGGVIGALFALLFGPVGWIAMGAAAGGLFASFDRGIKNKLLKELGQDMTSSESAVAILIEHANWSLAVERMRSYGFGGTVVVSEIVAEDTAEVERLLADPKTEPVPEEIEIPAPAVVAAGGGGCHPGGGRAGHLPRDRPDEHRRDRGHRFGRSGQARGGRHHHDRGPAVDAAPSRPVATSSRRRRESAPSRSSSGSTTST